MDIDSNMDFGANKTAIEVIKEGAFGETYFRDIYSGVNGKWYKKSWKEWKLKQILLVIMTLELISMVSCGTFKILGK